MDGRLFDVGASRAQFRLSGMPLHTLRHNGIAKTLRDVVVHYEKALGFKYTEGEREDLVAFLEAL